MGPVSAAAMFLASHTTSFLVGTTNSAPIHRLGKTGCQITKNYATQ